ncbi:MAG: hypothetical protein C0467_32160 [Planctomycetaceae bacterium]|nr:hypothetical protein [Planctomycetaceae bacterium]
MPRPRNAVPSYRLHKQSGQAIITISAPTGVRRDVLLGVHGSPESKAEYERQLALLRSTPVVASGSDLTVSELLVGFHKHAEQHYRHADGTQTGEAYSYKHAGRPLRELYGGTPAREFGPKALKTVREKMIQIGWSRSQVNAAVNRVRHIFKWGVGEELVPVVVLQALQSVAGLQAGRSAAHENDPILPVDAVVVEATLPYLGHHVRGAVEFQRLTGCRPGEACGLRWCDINKSRSVWTYQPPRHKNTHRGKPRTIQIGPKAQTLLEEFPTPATDDYLFSPVRAVEELIAQRAAGRKTPKYPSHMKRNATKRKGPTRKRQPAERYTKNSYGRAIDRACDRAFPPPPPLAKRGDESNTAWNARLTPDQRVELQEWKKCHRWAPNRLRHSYATAVRAQHGLEATQVLLGHSKADTTQLYTEQNDALAASVAAQIG